MPWLAALDAKAAKWSPAARWPYIGLKWLLIALGAYVCLGLAVREFREHRLGLGSGVVAAMLYGVSKGILSMRRQR